MALQLDLIGLSPPAAGQSLGLGLLGVPPLAVVAAGVSHGFILNEESLPVFSD